MVFPDDFSSMKSLNENLTTYWIVLSLDLEAIDKFEI